MSQFFWLMLVIGLGTAAYAIWRPSFAAWLVALMVNGAAVLIRFL
jgi:hypothetical protein